MERELVMAKIRVLSENMIHKIAAGEVIERPASVVKELVENSIDALAKRVHVEIKAGGKQSIEVSDDGVGMSREDAEHCILRHATSKMSSPSDLFDISTLGFRGEALASIGAVSRMCIETRSQEEPEGTRLLIEGGIRLEAMMLGRAPGTSVTVRNMFFNTPARRKFLRHVDTEARHITQAVVQLAAAYPEVGFELVHQGRTVLDFAGADQQERAAELLGMERDSLIHVSHQEDGINVEGFLSPPSLCRRSKIKQFLIVRGRPIVAHNINQAVYQGYGGLLAEDAHPPFILWLGLDPRRIDVNVHPTKREVRLADPRQVVEVVKAGVRHALAMPETPSFVYNQDRSEFRSSQIGEITPLSLDVGEEERSESGTASARKNGIEQMAFSLVASSTPKGERLGDDLSDEAGEVFPELKGNPSIWQIHNKYIASQIKDGIIIVDQQAADERILFEKALDRFKSEGGTSQQLLFPFTLHLGAVEKAVWTEVEGLLGQLGFGVREFGPETIMVDAIPTEMKNWGEGEVLYKILNDFVEEKDVVNGSQEALAVSYACHTSIRAGEAMSVKEMQGLVERLLETREPFVCPHGRPTIIKIRLKEMDRLFKRV